MVQPGAANDRPREWQFGRRANEEDWYMRLIALMAVITATAIAGHCSADEPADTRVYWVCEGGWFAKAKDGSWYELNEQTFRKQGKPSKFKEVKRTNRIGVGLTGVHEFAWKFFGYGFLDLLDEEKSLDFWLAMAQFNRAVADEAKKPEHNQDNNYGPEHG